MPKDRSPSRMNDAQVQMRLQERLNKMAHETTLLQRSMETALSKLLSLEEQVAAVRIILQSLTQGVDVLEQRVHRLETNHGKERV